MGFWIRRRRARCSRSACRWRTTRRFRMPSSASFACERTSVYDFLDIRRDGPVEYVTLNRPDVRNAFNEQVIAELTAWAAATRAAAATHAVRVAVLAGAGKTFSAGADVTWMSKALAYTEDENVRDATAMSHMFSALN